MNHGDMNHDEQCAMSMLLTTSTKNLCLLVPQWRITSTFSLLRALLLIFLFCFAFEGLRVVSSSRGAGGNRLKRSMVYMLQVTTSLIIMLLFMTYNLWVMLAVVAGAGAGHFFFTTTTDSNEGRSLLCH